RRRGNESQISSAYPREVRDSSRRLLLFQRTDRERITDDGLQLTTRGQGIVAQIFARELGFGKITGRAGKLDENGSWRNPDLEKLRGAIIEKNKLWFNYWRPQNWAFLGGDRTNQPSSRDHRDLNIRWFPQEMEKFVPLIAAKEREINELARRLP
ncbi:MAG: hypothetical protein ACR2H1_11435, partial [Limisphaerales bacterium]